MVDLSNPVNAHRTPLPDIGSYVAIGDSFTEGVGDPGPDGAYLGWADRFAARLAMEQPGLRYANLAVRGKLLHQIVEEQVPLAIAVKPDLVTLGAGGNDVLRPGSDPDRLAAEYEQAVAALTGAGARVVVFTGFDTRWVPVLRLIRGKIATYNEHLRAIADRYECPVADMWALTSLHDRRAWADDRLHLSPQGHDRVALKVGRAVGLTAEGDPDAPWPAEDVAVTAAAARLENVHWAREHLVPWIGRRLRGQSSGDDVVAKRPELALFESNRQAG